MATERTNTRFPWGLTIASALLFALLVSLGVWQVQRLQWKQALIEQAEAAAERPPAPVGELGKEDLTDFRRVILDCPGISTAPFVELQTILNGEPGVRLISACQLPSSQGYLLVDRGFVADTISARPRVQPSNAPVQIIGQVRVIPVPIMHASYPGEPPKRFFQRDEGWMGMALGVHPVIGTVFALTSSNPEWLALQPSAPPAAFSNNHLGYAITWFGLALALAGFYIALLRRKLSGDIAGTKDTP